MIHTHLIARPTGLRLHAPTSEYKSSVTEARGDDSSARGRPQTERAVMFRAVECPNLIMRQHTFSPRLSRYTAHRSDPISPGIPGLIHLDLSFTVITTGACDGTKDLHGRMPLVLDREGFEPWLAAETPTLSCSVDADLYFFPVTPRMNKPAYNKPDLHRAFGGVRQKPGACMPGSFRQPEVCGPRRRYLRNERPDQAPVTACETGSARRSPRRSRKP